MLDLIFFYKIYSFCQKYANRIGEHEQYMDCICRENWGGGKQEGGRDRDIGLNLTNPLSFHRLGECQAYRDICTELMTSCVWHVNCVFLLHSHVARLTQIAKFMGPTRGPLGSCRPQMGPMNLVIRGPNMSEVNLEMMGK